LSLQEKRGSERDLFSDAADFSGTLIGDMVDIRLGCHGDKADIFL
jgi:hypothetical protein